MKIYLGGTSMLQSLNLRRGAVAALTAALALLLAACLVLPGKFAATLDIRKDGQFNYTYKGELLILGLTKLAETAMKAGPVVKFELEPCYKDDGETARACTAAEAAKQRADWQNAQTAAAEKRDRDLAMFKKVFGGIDPNDPKAAQELAVRMGNQVGWNKVIYKGNGVYDVDISISGMLDRDFEFPTIERMPGMMPFLAIIRRANGEVRIDSPLMQYATLGMPGGAAAQAYEQDRAAKKGRQTAPWPDFPQANGHLTLTTDGVILSNNTEHGPKPVASGKQLDWDINGHTPIPPMALIGLGK